MTKSKKIRAYAVCFALNKKCLEGDLRIFTKRRDARSYIVDLHEKIGGFEDDHHIVPIEITIKR